MTLGLAVWAGGKTSSGSDLPAELVCAPGESRTSREPSSLLQAVSGW